MNQNEEQRARWLLDLISELQDYISKSHNLPESPLVKRALESIRDARQTVMSNATQ